MTLHFDLQAIATVRAQRQTPDDDFWGQTTAVIELTDASRAESLTGLSDFSHAEILFVFDRVPPEKIEFGARHPRNRADWPKVGIYAQRGKNRPNRLGSTIVRIVKVEGHRLTVAELDAIDGTPVLDIKPVMRSFLPRDPVREPAWASELMTEYWKVES